MHLFIDKKAIYGRQPFVFDWHFPKLTSRVLKGASVKTSLVHVSWIVPVKHAHYQGQALLLSHLIGQTGTCIDKMCPS